MITHVTPEGLEQEELETYAEEYAALEDSEDVDAINWDLSGIEDGGHHDIDISWLGVISSCSSMQSRVDIHTSGSRQLDFAPTCLIPNKYLILDIYRNSFYIVT